MPRRPARPRKLLLRNSFAVGDIVMLTAAVRDLHAACPGEFLTDVHTSCAELWENNPHITRHPEGARDVETLECDYPLINRSNETPYHCIHGFMEFLGERLDRRIRPTAFHGDVHLSPLEKSWYSQVHELTGEDTPFWIIAAGGKYDVPIKWWSTERYQAVVDHFQGRILFIQVGDPRHHHPPLQGVIDLRGRTDLRQLIRLVYHAQGVLCGVTGLMHLAAAVERKDTGGHDRPCVVVAGGREPAHWEAYPAHQFLHTNGALSCAGNGCWKSRVRPLGDGDERDQPENLCSQPVGDLPRCMDMITPDDVVRRTALYFDGGVVPYLTPAQAARAERAVVPRSTTVAIGKLPPPKPAPAPPSLPATAPPAPGLPRPGELTLVTLHDDAIAEVAAVTGERLDLYARRHGYRVVRYSRSLDPSRHPAWSKVLAVRHALLSRQTDWVLWLDADAVVMNPAVAATSLVQPGCDLIFATDFNGLNSGIFFARYSDWTLRFLDAAYALGDLREDPDGFGPKWEQNTFKHLLAHFAGARDHVVLLPQAAMNAYPEDYRPGDFILHLGGLTNAERLHELARILPPPAPDGVTA